MHTSNRLPRLLLFFFPLLLPVALFAQGITVKGTVRDQTKDEPLAGVTVQVKGSTTATMTDSLGRYVITVPNRKAILTFNYVGYVAQDQAVPKAGSMEITLTPSTASLNEVVVVGYGTQKRRDITGSVVSLDRQRLEDMPNTNFAQALEGSLPGVSVTTAGGGAEGENVNILIRGQKSITAHTDPLVILDGIPYNGSISDINPTDIASTEILKDASAAAIYGARASNGVILVTTKRGSNGKPVISYDGYAAEEKIANLPKILTPEQFYQFKVTREGPTSVTTSEQAVYDSKNFPNWLKLATQTGLKQQHGLSIRGGNTTTKYFASVNYLDTKGVAVNDRFKRLTTRINLEANLTKWLTYGTNTQLGYDNRSGLPATFSGENGAYFFNPLTTAYDSTGNLSIYPWPQDVHFANPLAPTLATNSDNAYQVFTANYLLIKFPFVPGLSYRFNTGFEYDARRASTYYGRNTADGLANNGDLSQSNSNINNTTIENILTYDRTFGKHAINFTGLYSYEKDLTTKDALDAQQFPSDALTAYQPDVALAVKPTSSYAKHTLISQMYRLNYSYDSRYLLTVTGRRDGSSVFGANNKFAFFPSVALGWNITNEKFMENNTLFSNLKLRLSYGSNGNEAVLPYSTLAQLTARNYIDNGLTAPGYVPQTLDNPDLRWETTNSANVGIDFGLLKGRIQGSLDVYHTKTHDLLLARQISPVQGISSITQNIGKTENQGIELSVGAVAVQQKDFTWSLNGNIALNRNKILELYGDGKNDTLNNWYIGHPINSDLGYVFGGVWQLNDDTLHGPQGPVHPGQAKIKDINHDGVINSYDRTIIGNHQPSFTWGLGNTFKYKAISLYVFVQGVEGTSQANYLLSEGGVQAGVRHNTVVKDWWTPTNPTNTYWINSISSNPLDVHIVQSDAYVRVKDMMLSYDFSHLVSGSGVSRLRLYVEARNLFTFTKWTGLDPEFASAQTEMPLQKEYLVGLNVSF
ncbi:MAG TPA: TonB-dependent receptor [Puia sp.]|nr:TonB-dependent receptor [Puia sp.]